MPGRAKGSRNRSTLAFQARYDVHQRRQRRVNKAAGLEADAPTDPFEVLWSLALDPAEESQHRIAAARALLPYRYPTMRAIEVNANGEAVDVASEGGQLVLAWDADADGDLDVAA